MTFKTFFLLVLVSFSSQRVIAQNKARDDKLIPIPTEEEVGRVFISGLTADYALSPPSAIWISPVLFSKNGEVMLSNQFSALIERKDIGVFMDKLVKPTKISTADESCLNVIFAWNETSMNTSARVLSGRIMIDPDKDRVRIRLKTDNPFYTRIDFVYEGTGLKRWLEQRSIAFGKIPTKP